MRSINRATCRPGWGRKYLKRDDVREIDGRAVHAHVHSSKKDGRTTPHARRHVICEGHEHRKRLRGRYTDRAGLAMVDAISREIVIYTYIHRHGLGIGVQNIHCDAAPLSPVAIGEPCRRLKVNVGPSDILEDHEAGFLPIGNAVRGGKDLTIVTGKPRQVGARLEGVEQSVGALSGRRAPPNRGQQKTQCDTLHTGIHAMSLGGDRPPPNPQGVAPPGLVHPVQNTHWHQPPILDFRQRNDAGVVWNAR